MARLSVEKLDKFRGVKLIEIYVLRLFKAVRIEIATSVERLD
jgi:hypothetical protein